jgi:CRP-like cAMP-binding protein
VHFFGPPSPSRGSSKPIAEEIVRVLTPYQFTSRLCLVPFDLVQRQIVAAAHESYRLLLYRRMMARIAREIARAERALGLVTGDSVSQVASQTLHNLAALDRGLDFPIYRPLAGDDKAEILKLARQIGTYKISCEPFEDCCPRFMPRSPAIFARPEQLHQAESGLDIEGLVTLGLEGVSVLDYKFENGQVSAREAAPRRLQSLVARRKGVPLRKGAQVRLDIPKAELARHLGTAPETLSRAFGRLAAADLLDVDGKVVTFRKAASLEALAGGEQLDG